jgi:hypothetical protein
VRPRSATTLVTASANEPVSLAEVKAWGRIDGTTDDPLLTALIGASRAATEEFLRRSLITQTWRLSLDLPASRAYRDLPEGVYELPVTALYGGLPREIALPRGPLRTVTSVTTYDTSNTGSVYASSNYLVDTASDRIVLNDTAVWPGVLRQRAACQIEYTAGYGADATDVPQPIRTAICMHVSALYESRGQCEGDVDLPAGCKQLLRQYRIIGDARG